MAVTVTDSALTLTLTYLHIGTTILEWTILITPRHRTLKIPSHIHQTWPTPYAPRAHSCRQTGTHLQQLCVVQTILHESFTLIYYNYRQKKDITFFTYSNYVWVFTWHKIHRSLRTLIYSFIILWKNTLCDIIRYILLHVSFLRTFHNMWHVPCSAKCTLHLARARSVSPPRGRGGASVLQ